MKCTQIFGSGSYIGTLSVICGNWHIYHKTKGNRIDRFLLQDFPAVNQNAIAILVIMWALIHMFEEHHELSDAICRVRENFYTTNQGQNMSLQYYHEVFISQVGVG